MIKLKKILLAVGCCLTIGAAYFGALQLFGNFHTVVEGLVYRSAQPNASDISRYVNEYGIKSIINLRGSNAGKAWYDDEIEAATRYGVKHVDFRMSASRELSDADIAALVQLMKDVPKPVLIHCKSGADRTGLAAALYLHDVQKIDIEKAEGQLSPLYGHIGIPYLSAAYPMDLTWERFEASRKLMAVQKMDPTLQDDATPA